MIKCGGEVIESGDDEPIQTPVQPSHTSKSVKKSGRKKDPHPWHDIFAQCKLMVSIQTKNPENCELIIHFAQDNFFQNFGFSRDQLPMPFHALCGKASIRYNTHRIQLAILTGKEANEYQNLYKRDGFPLSCHISTLSLIGTRATPLYLQSNEKQGIENPSMKWAMMTIRSASVVGNTIHSGIGILGVDGIPEDALQRATTAAAASSSSSSSSSNNTNGSKKEKKSQKKSTASS